MLLFKEIVNFILFFLYCMAVEFEPSHQYSIAFSCVAQMTALGQSDRIGAPDIEVCMKQRGGSEIRHVE